MIPSLILLICNICIILGLRGFESSVKHNPAGNASSTANSAVVTTSLIAKSNGADKMKPNDAASGGASNRFLSRRRQAEVTAAPPRESRRIGANAAAQTTRMVAMLLTVSFMFLLCNLPIVIMESKSEPVSASVICQWMSVVTHSSFA